VNAKNSLCLRPLSPQDIIDEVLHADTDVITAIGMSAAQWVLEIIRDHNEVGCAAASS
jgi:hypothetical protein